MEENLQDSAVRAAEEWVEPLKRRQPGLAGLLSLCVPGLGHVYAGSTRRGGLLFVGYALLMPVLLVLHCELDAAPWNILPIAAMPLLQAGFAFDAARLTRKGLRLGAAATGPRRAWMLWLLVGIPAALGWILVLRAFVAQAFKIPSAAMEETLLIGDHIFVDKYSYRFGSPARGDVIVFQFPPDPTKDYVKRIIGLPGETVEIRRPEVFVNGARLDEPYAVYRRAFAKKDGTFVVPADAYFVLGDNRDNSEDSRFWGALPRQLIRGKVRRVYFSWDTREFDQRTQEEPALQFPLEFLRTIRWGRTGQTVR
jgi:signal peptidase I